MRGKMGSAAPATPSWKNERRERFMAGLFSRVQRLAQRGPDLKGLNSKGGTKQTPAGLPSSPYPGHEIEYDAEPLLGGKHDKRRHRRTIRIPALHRYADRLQPAGGGSARAPWLRLHRAAPALPVPRPAAHGGFRQDRD